MANAFKGKYLDITNSVQTLYTVPASTEAVVNSIRITNVNGTTADAITCDIVDASSGNARIASTISVPADSSLELIQNKIFLEAGDIIKLTGNQSTGYLEAYASVLEIS